MKAYKLLLILVMTALLHSIGWSQNSCIQNLRDARNAYDEGKFKALPDLLSNCIEKGFSKQEKIEALRLVTLSYLFKEEPKKAEITYLRLLNVNPEYKPKDDSDPTELILLAEGFDTKPKFFYGFKTGVSYSIMETKPEVAHNMVSLGSYDFPLGISGGVFFQYPIQEKFSVNLEIHYNYRNTTLNRPISSDIGSNFHSIDETQQWLEIPLLVNYELPWLNQFAIEATAGPSFQYVVSSTLNVRGLGLDLNNFDILPYRNQFNMSGIAGIRVNFKELGANFITTELIFQYRILSEVNKEAMPEEVKIDLASKHAYTDYEYRGHAVWIRVGLRFPYFKPELIK